jgi:hypothetical protein
MCNSAETNLRGILTYARGGKGLAGLEPGESTREGEHDERTEHDHLPQRDTRLRKAGIVGDLPT